MVIGGRISALGRVVGKSLIEKVTLRKGLKDVRQPAFQISGARGFCLFEQNRSNKFQADSLWQICFQDDYQTIQS